MEDSSSKLAEGSPEVDLAFLECRITGLSFIVVHVLYDRIIRGVCSRALREVPIAIFGIKGVNLTR